MKIHEKLDKRLQSSVCLKPHGLWSARRGSLHASSCKQKILRARKLQVQQEHVKSFLGTEVSGVPSGLVKHNLSLRSLTEFLFCVHFQLSLKEQIPISL